MGEHFHESMERLRRRSWVAKAGPVGYLVLDREAATFFVRTPKAKFPGRLMLERCRASPGGLFTNG